MDAPNPRVREDLEITPRVVDGEVVYIVGDPIKNEFHQLDEVQYTIFRLFDGQTSLAAMVPALAEEHEIEVDEETLAAFVELLQDLNLLDLSADTRLDRERGREISARVKRQLELAGVVFAPRITFPPREHQPPAGGERRQRLRESVHVDQALNAIAQGDIQGAARRLRQVIDLAPRNQRARYLLNLLLEEHLGKPRNKDSIWWWRFPIANPDRFLSALDRLVGRFLFTKTFLYAWTVFFLSAIGLVIWNFDDLNRDMLDLFSFRWLYESPSVLILVWSVGPMITILHEVSHGLACRHYGGRVREMGILVAYLSPTAFCDISSTYLFEDKWQRVIVAMAGLMWHAAIWSVFVFIYHVTSTDTTIGWLAMMSVPVLALTLIFGLSPAIRSDAYIALSELLNHPNLRPEAFSYLSLLGQRLVLGSAVEIPEELQAKRRVLLWYSVPSLLGTVIVIYGVFSRIAYYVAQNFHSLGLLVFSIIITMYAAGPVTRAVRAVWRNRNWLWAQKRFRKVLALGSGLFVLSLALPWPFNIDVPFLVKPRGEWVRAPDAGTVDRVLVENGALVESGAALVQLNADAARAAEQQSWAKLAMAEADLHKLLAGKRSEEIAIQEADVRAAWGELQSWRAQVARLSRLKTGGGAVEEYDRARMSMAAAETSYATAKKALESALAGAQDEEVQALEARMEMLRAQWESDRAGLEATLLRSPIAGRVRFQFFGGDETPHLVKVAAGDPIAFVRAEQAPYLEARVPITAPVNLIQPGARALARLRGRPNELLVGEASRVQSSLDADRQDQTESGARAYIPVDVELRGASSDESDLPEGLTGILRITAGWYPVAMHLYLRMARLVRIDLNRLIG
ncbi:MAG: hypothetical protein JXR83_17555 [Deltaproteobacteria bacterium]|nr:hypothetical protein [Deltaproteobacteria bacterium]